MEKRILNGEEDLADLYLNVKRHLDDGIRQVKITIDYGDNRSLPQNDLFHMWCNEFAKGLTDLGRPCDEKEAKLFLKSKFLGFENLKVGKMEIKEQLRETSKLNSGEMYFFMEEVWQYAATTFGIYLTVPVDSQFAKNKSKSNMQD